MNAFSVILFIIIVTIFGGIIYTAQQDSSKKLQLPSHNILTPSPTVMELHLPQFQNQQQQSQTSQSQLSQTASNPTASVEEQPRASYSAVIKTTKGTIAVTLYSQAAPNTVKNFIDKAQSGYYNNLLFHRVENWVIQGGDPKGDGTGGGQMASELNDAPFTKGSLGIARGQDIRINNDSQFFITKSDASWLNRQYTNFGIVTDGMDVVSKIQIGDKILGITVL